MNQPRTIDFSATESPVEAIRVLLRVRFAECLEKQHVLAGEDDEAIHSFRLCCKRLRYAIERWPDQTGELQPIGDLLSEITDALGTAHDCVVLAARAAETQTLHVQRIAMRDRGRYVKRARVMWRRAFRRYGAFAPLAKFTAYHWSLNGSR